MFNVLRNRMAMTAMFGFFFALTQATWAVTFPNMETFSNDTDSYDPPPDGGSMLGDPLLDGSPPPAFPWGEIRTGGPGVVEEVPTGYNGITASSGNHFGFLEFESGDGPAGHPSSQQLPLADPWSYQLDVYTDPDIDSSFGAGQGGHGNGSNGVPDFWWTSSVWSVDGSGQPGASGYLTESGFTGEVVQTALGPRVWRYTTTAGGQPFIEVPLDTWVTLEVQIIPRASDTSKADYIHKIWNQAHTELLYSHVLPAYLDPNWINVGGPRSSWFVYPDNNMPHLFIDNMGVASPIELPPSFILGDMDGDGDRDNFDIDDFELALTNSTAYLALHPTLTDYQQRGDIEGDGDFDNFDIQPFEQLLTGGPGGAPVPEPSSIVLFGLGAVGLALTVRRRRAC